MNKCMANQENAFHLDFPPSDNSCNECANKGLNNWHCKAKSLSLFLSSTHWKFAYFVIFVCVLLDLHRKWLAFQGIRFDINLSASKGKKKQYDEMKKKKTNDGDPIDEN